MTAISTTTKYEVRTGSGVTIERFDAREAAFELAGRKLGAGFVGVHVVAVTTRVQEVEVYRPVAPAVYLCSECSGNNRIRGEEKGVFCLYTYGATMRESRDLCRGNAFRKIDWSHNRPAKIEALRGAK